MTQPNREAFEIAIRSLRESKNPEAFSMRGYGHRKYINARGDTFVYNDEDLRLRDNPHCGSPMCVLGHVAAREDLQDFLKFEANTGTIWYAEPLLEENADGDLVEHRAVAQYTDPQLCEWFGITQEQTEALFGVHGCDHARTIDEAITYLEDFLHAHESNDKARAALRAR